MDNQPIIIEATIKVPASGVWKALTDTQEMKNWYFDIQSFEAKPGFEFKFYGGETDKRTLHLCKVTEVEPQKKLAYTWQFENSLGNSLLVFELTEIEWQTKLKVTHEGVESFANDGPEFSKQNFAKSWNNIIDGLKKHLETPKALVEKSVLIDASMARVWEVITSLDLVRKWACGFCEGTYVESSWEKGTSVEWKFGEGVICAKGVVGEVIPNRLLKVDFYESESKNGCKEFEFSDKIGAYSEIFELSEQDGKTLLVAKAGLLKEAEAGFMGGLWDKAMALIKETSENN